MQEVPVQVGQLLAGAHLLQVVGGDHQQVAQGVERVEELQHQGHLWDSPGGEGNRVYRLVSGMGSTSVIKALLL